MATLNCSMAIVYSCGLVAVVAGRVLLLLHVQANCNVSPVLWSSIDSEPWVGQLPASKPRQAKRSPIQQTEASSSLNWVGHLQKHANNARQWRWLKCSWRLPIHWTGLGISWQQNHTSSESGGAGEVFLEVTFANWVGHLLAGHQIMPPDSWVERAGEVFLEVTSGLGISWASNHATQLMSWASWWSIPRSISWASNHAPVRGYLPIHWTSEVIYAVISTHWPALGADCYLRALSF